MRIAKSVRQRLPKHTSDADLTASALFGLLRAAQSYDENRGPFIAHAYKRIHGAIVDDLRSMMWGHNRDKRTGGYKCVAKGKPYGPRFERRARRMVQCDHTASVPAVFALDEEDAFTRLLAPLNARERYIVAKHHRDGLFQRETGELLGLTESRVNQILRVAYAKIRVFLDRRERDALVDERRRHGAVGNSAVEKVQTRVRAPAFERVG